jgi:hypothetical protein
MVLAESSVSRPSRYASFDTSAPAKEWLLIEGECFARWIWSFSHRTTIAGAQRRRHVWRDR